METPLATIQNEIKQEKKRKKKRRIRAWIKVVAIFLILCLLVVAFVQYDKSKYSRVNLIAIKNNHVLSDDEVLEWSEVSLDERVYLQVGFLIENKINNHPMIEDSKVSINCWLQSVSIQIIEKKFIAYINNNQQTSLLSEEGQLLAITDLSLIADLPLISGYTNEHFEELVKFLTRIEPSIYGSISEMRRKPTSYDETQIEFQMSDGIIITSPLSGLELLTSENYYGVINRLDSDKRCILIDPFTQSMVASVCE
ncbi:MAG: hypothetical protein GX778_00095 [Erysipelothrix sp.]|nr:hypothetical protein [Erysipelothrix sp.]